MGEASSSALHKLCACWILFVLHNTAVHPICPATTKQGILIFVFSFLAIMTCLYLRCRWLSLSLLSLSNTVTMPRLMDELSVLSTLL